MMSRDQFDDSSSLETQDHEDLSTWQQGRAPPGIPSRSENPTENHGRTLGVVRGVSSQYRSPMKAGMATADNRHSLAPDVPERTTSKRFSVPVGEGLLSSTSPPHLSLKHTMSTNSASSVPGSPTDVPEPPPDLEDLPWYHFNISRHVAESVLISTGEDGSYLLRDSTSNAGEFTLSVRAKNSVKHYPVRWDGHEFQFGFGRFTSVEELRDHFASRPVIGGESGVLTLLKFPYPRCVEEPETYDQVRVHAEWGAATNRPDSQKPTFAIASKEGYLTKLGFRRKNWLTRWFVLFKNELSYYKSREEKLAIKTIDLKDVMDVLADDSQGKQNCFKIITPYRTFFLYAGSAQEAEDWIKILRWKLDHPSGLETARREGRV